MRSLLCSTAIVTAIFLASCSNRAVYDALQGSGKLDCQKRPQGQYEECMRDNDQSYDSYEKERESALEERNSSY